MTSEFVFFSSNPSLNHIKIEKCLLLIATNTNIFTLLFNELKTDGKSFIFAVCRLTYDHVTSNLTSLLWYLPHHPVFNTSKPGKVHVVFDCGAKHQGTSLNDQLLQVPDLTNNLVGVLTRFQQEPVALMANVESMFHQVRVSPNNCDALQFLWWPNNDLNSEPEEYQIMVHLFGATSSPSCPNFGLWRTAEDNYQEFSKETVDSVKDNFYVDDCLKSVPSKTKAIGLIW